MSSLPFPSAMAASGADCNGSEWRVFGPDTVAGSWKSVDPVIAPVEMFVLLLLSSSLLSVEKKLKDSNQLNMIWNIIWIIKPFAKVIISIYST